jgi:outer membrane protein
MHFRPQLAAPLFALSLLTAGAAHAQTAAPADSLTLDATIRAVLEANPGILSLQEQVNAAQGRVAQSRTGYLPYVTGTATYTRVDPVVKLPLGDQVFQLAPNNNYDTHITAQYMLLDFGKNAATVNAATAAATTVADNVVTGQRDLAYEAVQVYYSILFLRQGIRVQESQIASLQQHQREMEKRVQGGVSTQFDVTSTQVRIAQAQDTRIDLQNQLHNQQAELARLLHRPEYAEVPVRGAFTYNPQQVDVNTAFTQASQNRPEVKAARDAEAAATAQLRLIEKSNLPSLGAQAQAGGKNGYVPQLDRFRANSVLAIRSDVQQAVNNMQSSSARYDNSTVQVNQATDALNRAKSRYRYGVGTNLDVLDAETQLAQARLSRLQSIYNYTIGQYQLKRATGEQIW